MPLQSVTPNINGLNVMDRKGVTVSAQEYERIIRDAGNRFGDLPNQLNFGQRFEQAINSKLTDEVIGKMVGSVFGGATTTPAKSATTGFLGEVYKILDTNFAAQIGRGIGENITGLVKELGSDRIGRVIDSYTGQTGGGQSPEGQGQSQLSAPEEEKISPEEQQRRSENALMTLDASNIEHLNIFMNASKITNVSVAQRALLAEQHRILQRRGLAASVENPVNEEPAPRQRSQRRQSTNPPDDLNRQLMQQYDDSSQSSPHTSSSARGDNDFFSNNPSPFSQEPTGNSQQSPEDVILSLSPDEPSSLHTYMALKGIAGVEQTIVKKMLIKEQEYLRKNMLNPPQLPIQEISQPSPPIDSPKSPVQDNEIDRKWGDRDAPRKIINDENTSSRLKTENEEGTVIKRSDFYKEINIKPDKQPFSQSQESNKQAHPENRISEQSDIKQSHSSNDISNIVSLIEGLGNNFEQNMKSVSDNIQAMSNKIHLLEDEIITLKSKVPVNNPYIEQEEIVYSDIVDIDNRSTEKEIPSYNNKKALTIMSLNDITKDETGETSFDSIKNPIRGMNDISPDKLNSPEREELKNIEGGVTDNDNSNDFSNNGKDESKVPETEDENNKDMSEKGNETADMSEIKERPVRIVKRRSKV